MTTSLDNIEQLVKDLSGGEDPSNVLPGLPANVSNLEEAVVRPRGYRQASKAQVPWPPAGSGGPGLQAPKPLPKRPKGRLFIGTFLIAICGIIGWSVWDAFLSVAAFGVVKADTLRISTPFDGRIAELHVREGQFVHRGDLLVKIDSVQLRRQLARLKDELHVEEARLESESIRIQQESQEYAAEYYALWARLQKHREELTRLQRDLQRVLALNDPTIISAEELDRKRFAESGQRALVEKLSEALAELRKRADAVPHSSAPATELQLRPIRAKIDYLKGEIERVHEELLDGEVYAPVNGTVVRCHAAVGQQLIQTEEIIEIVDCDSLMIELFVPQRKTHHLRPGHSVDVSIEPISESMTCTVIGSRDCYEMAPDSIRRYYRSGETLMPVMLKPEHAMSHMLLRSGAIVRLRLWEHVVRTWNLEKLRNWWEQYISASDTETAVRSKPAPWQRVRTVGALMYLPEGEPS